MIQLIQFILLGKIAQRRAAETAGKLETNYSSKNGNMRRDFKYFLIIICFLFQCTDISSRFKRPLHVETSYHYVEVFFYAFLTFHGCKRPRTSVPVPKWLASNLRQTLSICDFRLTVVFVHADINFLILPETGDRSYKQFPRKYRSRNEANVCLHFTVLPGNHLLPYRITVHVHRWLFNSAMGGQNVLSIFEKSYDWLLAKSVSRGESY